MSMVVVNNVRYRPDELPANLQLAGTGAVVEAVIPEEVVGQTVAADDDPVPEVEHTPDGSVAAKRRSPAKNKARVITTQLDPTQDGWDG